MTASVEPFGFVLPTRIRFGAGSSLAVGDIARGHGNRIALVVGRSASANPAVREAIATLVAARSIVVAERVVHGEPDDGSVVDLAAELLEARPDVVVAIGGGSVVDLVKAAALLPGAERLEVLMAGERVDAPRIPVVALPTTAGSGAEVSHGAIVLDRASGRKRGVRGPGVAARDALVDPSLMVGAPPEVIAASGFDAVAHAVETSASRAASELTLHLAATALPRLLDGVATAYRDPRDLGALSNAAYGALLMGVNLANSTTCLPHRLQYPVGARTGTSHALGVAALFPAWLARTVEVAPAALARLARAAGLAATGASDREAAEVLAGRVLDQLERTGMRVTLRDLGIDDAALPDLVGRVEGNLANDPGPVAVADLHAIYAASLEENPWTP